MDRQIVYPGAIPLETDLLNTNKNAMIGLSKLAAAILGTSTFLNGLDCTPNSPADLTVKVAPGEIYSLQNIDGTAYSSIAADTTHAILKQGIMLDQVTLACPAPVTAGQSVNYLIQVAYQDTDASAVVLPYYNSSNPSQAYAGPANSGTAQNTVRKGVCAVSAKAGVAATTGAQTTPAPDAGYIGAFVVTVAYGQTQINAGNVSAYGGAPFLPSAGLVVGGLQGNACNISAAGGTADAITGSYTPGIAALTNGMTLYVRAGSANATATPTFTPNSGTIAAKTIVKGAGAALVAGDIAGGGHWIELQYDATLDKWVLLNPAMGVNVATNFRKNLVVDGACRLSQTASKTLTTSAQYGAVDMFAAWATGTAVSAGSITQNSGAPIGQEGYSLHLSGVTITGAGVVYARHRIESAIAKQLKNQTASFSVQVYHDVGSSVNYTAVIRKPTAADNFTSTTVISTSSAQAVPNASGTLLTFAGVAMGDCSNGIEIEVQAACGAVTTKNFHFTEWQLELGASATSFDRPPIADNIRAVERYLEKSYDLTTNPGTVTFAGAFHGDASAISDITVPFRERKRATPTLTFYSALSGSSGTICYQNCIGSPTPSGDTAVVQTRISTANVVVESNPGDQYMPIIHYVADCRL